MCPVLLQSAKKPSMESMQSYIDSMGIECVLHLWNLEFGKPIVVADFLGRKVPIEGHLQDADSVIQHIGLYEEYFEGCDLDWSATGRFTGWYSDLLAMLIEICLCEIADGVIYEECDCSPYRSEALRESLSNHIRVLQTLNYLVDHYKTRDQIAWDDIPLLDGFTPDQRFHTLDCMIHLDKYLVKHGHTHLSIAPKACAKVQEMRAHNLINQALLEQLGV